MPNAVVKSYAQKTGKSILEIEKMWTSVEKSVRNDPKNKSLDDKKVYELVNGTVKKNLGLREGDEMEVTKKNLVDRLIDKVESLKTKKTQVVVEAVNKDQELVMKSKDVISHVNQALDILKTLKKAPGTKGERFKYFSTYLSNFLDNQDETNQTGFVPWVGQIENDVAAAGQSQVSMRGDEPEDMETDQDGGDYEDDGMADDSGYSSDEMEESIQEEVNAILAEGVDKKGEKVDFDSLPEALQTALKDLGLKSKVDTIVLQGGEKHSFFKVFLDMESLGNSMFKKFAESTVAPVWVSSHKDKVVLGFKAPKAKKAKKKVEAETEKEKKVVKEAEELRPGWKLGGWADGPSPSKYTKDGNDSISFEAPGSNRERASLRIKKSHGTVNLHLGGQGDLQLNKSQARELLHFITRSLSESLASASGIPGVDDVPGTPAGNEHTTVNKEDITVAEAAIAKAKEALVSGNLEEISNLFTGLKVTIAAKMNTLAERMNKSRKYSAADAKFLVDRIEKFVKSNKSKAE